MEAEGLHKRLPHVLGSQPPFDVLALCRHFCVDAFAYPFSRSLDGCLIHDGTYYAIGVNARHSKARRRFTAAHELYHYLAHGWKMPGVACVMSPGGDSLDEAQASVFAAELLMPQPWVWSWWGATGDVGRCAGLFGVSVTAMARRLRELSLVRRRA